MATEDSVIVSITDLGYVGMPKCRNVMCPRQQKQVHQDLSDVLQAIGAWHSFQAFGDSIELLPNTVPLQQAMHLSIGIWS